MPFDLSYGRRIYDWWGRHPGGYCVAAWLTLLGKEHSLRARAVDSLALEPGATVLDLGCGTGANFAFIERVVGPAVVWSGSTTARLCSASPSEGRGQRDGRTLS